MNMVLKSIVEKIFFSTIFKPLNYVFLCFEMRRINSTVKKMINPIIRINKEPEIKVRSNINSKIEFINRINPQTINVTQHAISTLLLFPVLFFLKNKVKTPSLI